MTLTPISLEQRSPGQRSPEQRSAASGLTRRSPATTGPPGACGIESMASVAAFTTMLAEAGDLPYLCAHEGIAGNRITVGGRSLVNFASYNYLATNGSQEITSAVTQAITRYGTSVSASRLISGEIPLHGELETEIADFLGVDAAIVQVGGHSTNVNILGNLFGEEDLILHDALAHNSLIQGALLSRARRKPFRHNDMQSLRRELERVRSRFRHVVIVVEGAYSMDGDLCPLPELVALRNEFDCFLMVDEAHSIGTVGEAGRGVSSHFGVDPRQVDILMGTLSKSLNSCGGYVAGHQRFIDYLKYNLPGFVFSVGMTPSNTAAALASLRLCRENPGWTGELRTRTERLRQGIRGLGADTGHSHDTPIVPLIMGSSQQARELAAALFEHGVNVDPITYPAVKESEARLRFFVSRAHSDEDLDLTLSALGSLLHG